MIVVCFAAVGGVLAGLSGLPSLLGYLLAGCVVGPGGAGMVEELVQVETLAYFGVLFIIFELGLHFSVAHLRKVFTVSVLGGLAQVLLIAAWVVMDISQGLSLDPLQAAFVGVILAMSSTAVVSKCLLDSGQTDTDHGQIMLGVLIMQDCLLGLTLAVMPAVKHPRGAGRAVLKELALLGLLTVGVVQSRRRLAPALVRRLAASAEGRPEVFTLGVVAICLSLAWTARGFGLSPEVGAFAAGVMFCEAPHTQHILRQISSVVHLFSALFMASIGLLIRPAFLLQHLPILWRAVVTVFVVKSFAGTVATRVFGFSQRTSLTVGVALSQVGEFGFVLLGRAKAHGLITRKSTYLLLVGTNALSLLLAPLVWKLVTAFLVRPGPGRAGRARELRVKLTPSASFSSPDSPTWPLTPTGARLAGTLPGGRELRYAPWDGAEPAGRVA